MIIRTGRIGIHEDDDPHVLARNFAITFQLTEDVQNDLENLIAQQLEDYYAKQEQNYYKD